MWKRSARNSSHEDLVAEDEGWSVETFCVKFDSNDLLQQIEPVAEADQKDYHCICISVDHPNTQLEHGLGTPPSLWLAPAYLTLRVCSRFGFPIVYCKLECLVSPRS